MFAKVSEAVLGNARRWIVAGVAGTLVLVVFMEGIARVVLGAPMKPSGLILQVLGWDPSMLWLAEIVHYGLGLIVFPVGFVVFRTLVARGSTLVLGLAWGVVLWLAAAVVVAPAAGMPPFFGGGPILVASLVAHLAYGATLGAVYARRPAAGSDAPA